MPGGKNDHRSLYAVETKTVKIKSAAKAKPATKTYQSIIVDIYEQQKAMTMLAVVIAILAADFPMIFKRELCKTEEFGISLMDTGVALITLNSGMSSRKARPWNQARSCFGVVKDASEAAVGVIFPLVAGMFRILLVDDLDY